MGIPLLENISFDFRQFDLLAEQSTHRSGLPSPVISVLTTLACIVSVASFDRYSVSALLPYFLYPLVLSILSCLPGRVLLAKVLLVLPFALLIAIMNPLLDRSVACQFGQVTISGGWISFSSIMLRAALTAAAALSLLAATGFSALCSALERLGLPLPLVSQLLFMYRYLHLLIDDARMASKARVLRSQGNQGMGIRPYSSMLSHLLIRSWERAERIHMAMLARGFKGQFPARYQRATRLYDYIWLLGWLTLFILCRIKNLPLLLGRSINGLF